MEERLPIERITARCTVRLLGPEDAPALLDMAAGHPLFYQHLRVVLERTL